MSVNIAQIIQKLTEEKVEPKDVEEIIKKVRSVVVRARKKLGKQIREFWDSEEGELIKTLLSIEAETSGYASEVERIMQEKSDELERVAKILNIGNLYRMVWGKRPRKRKE